MPEENQTIPALQKLTDQIEKLEQATRQYHVEFKRLHKDVNQKRALIQSQQTQLIQAQQYLNQVVTETNAHWGKRCKSLIAALFFAAEDRDNLKDPKTFYKAVHEGKTQEALKDPAAYDALIAKLKV
jgi:chromosome segregation ATPase